MAREWKEPWQSSEQADTNDKRWATKLCTEKSWTTLGTALFLDGFLRVWASLDAISLDCEISQDVQL